jgi:hypothetical protein
VSTAVHYNEGGNDDEDEDYEPAGDYASIDMVAANVSSLRAVPSEFSRRRRPRRKDMQPAPSKDGLNPSQLITNHIAELADWRGHMLARLRELILEADPDISEEWKWDTPVWSHKGNVVAIGSFKDHVKLNFFKGASLNDPHGLFNAGLEAKASRAIDLHEGDAIDESAVKELVRAAVALNLSGGKKK